MSADASRPVRLWLWCVAALVFTTVIVGGATRLTESGLSIVEWRPVTGMVPPLSQAEWAAEFEKYKVIPQYELVNKGMSLDDFKVIFWWEWVHRILGRVIGVAFLLPFLWFLWRGAIAPGMRAGLAVIFGLGALQGGVGWWMVASGLSDRIHVSHDRLAFHFTLACVIYAAIIWTAARLVPAPAPAAPPLRLRLGAFVLVSADDRAVLSRRAGGRATRGPHLQHLAADGRALHPARRRLVLRRADLGSTSWKTR